MPLHVECFLMRTCPLCVCVCQDCCSDAHVGSRGPTCLVHVVTCNALGFVEGYHLRAQVSSALSKVSSSKSAFLQRPEEGSSLPLAVMQWKCTYGQSVYKRLDGLIGAIAWMNSKNLRGKRVAAPGFQRGQCRGCIQGQTTLWFPFNPT